MCATVFASHIYSASHVAMGRLSLQTKSANWGPSPRYDFSRRGDVGRELLLSLKLFAPTGLARCSCSWVRADVREQKHVKEPV